MKSLLYIPLLLAGLLLATTLSAQEEKCPLRPFEFDPNIVQRDVPNPELDTTPIPLGKETKKFRKIYWVHGMKGNAGSWSRAVEYTQKNWASYAVTRTLEYEDAQYSLPTAAAHLNSNNNFPEYYAEDTLQAQEMKQDFIIAHSMGGLVSRYLDKHFNDNPDLAKPFGGLITFGTPHAGAQLARVHVHDTLLLKHFVKTTCYQLLSGPTEEIVKKNKLFSIIENLTFKTNFSELLKDIACQKVAGIAMNFIGNQFAVPAEKDMVPNSDELKFISNVPSIEEKLHTLVFYGEEYDMNNTKFGDGDMAIRFLFSTQKNPNTYELMKADEMDDQALADASAMLSYYDERTNYWMNLAREYAKKKAKEGPYSEEYYLKNSKKYQIAMAFDQGVRWFKLLNGKWKMLIGALEVVPINDPKCYCRCMNEEIGFSENTYEFYVEYPVPCDQPQVCNTYTKDHPLGCNFTEKYDLIIEEMPSDGLVTKETAIAMPNMQEVPKKMTGSGHFQMRNDSNLESELNIIFKGGVYDNYFKLEK